MSDPQGADLTMAMSFSFSQKEDSARVHLGMTKTMTKTHTKTNRDRWGYPGRYGEEEGEEGLVLEYSSSWISQTV